MASYKLTEYVSKSLSYLIIKINYEVNDMSIIEKFKSLPTTCISDSLNGLNNLEATIKPVSTNLSVVGRAFTVKLPASDNLMLLKAIREAKPGDVLTVDAKGYMNNASAGDFVIGLAKTLGLSGVVIDGVVRDIAGIRDLNFPVFCKGVTTAASEKHGTGEVNIPISCGDTVISPGDIIIGDEDGVVCVPKNKEEMILALAQGKLKKDQDREQKILGNIELAKSYIDKQLSN